jgi:Domain of unknown function (DUF4375)
MSRVPCLKCGESIHPDTAVKNDGLCMPCKGGYRDRIEAGKLRREEEKKYDQSAEGRYWRFLSSRVQESAEGFAGLTSAEKTYYAIGCLIGEVYNGGHEQYFFNYSGSMYGAALAGLLELEAFKTAALLQRAKELLFGERPVPFDTDARRSFLRERNQAPPDLEDIDKAFWKNDESLDKRCEKYAHDHQLYRDA